MNSWNVFIIWDVPRPPFWKWFAICCYRKRGSEIKVNRTFWLGKGIQNSHKFTCQQQKDSSSVLTTVQLDSFNTSTFGVSSIFHCWRNNFTISNQSQHCSEESFSTLLQREEAFMWSENTRLIFFFFFLFLWNAAVQTARVNCLSSLL